MSYQSLKTNTQIDPKVVEAAERLLASTTGTDFTMDELAAAAGLSRASVYRRIGSKDALLQHIAHARGISPADLGQRDVRATILQAARQCFGQRGLVSVTMEQIAQEAGVGVATVYRHFGDKQNLLRAFSDELKPEQLLTETLATGTGDLTGDLAVDLVPLVVGLLAFIHKNRDIFRLTLAENPENLALVRNLRNTPERTLYRLARLFQEQIDAGRIIKDDPMQMAQALMGMILAFGFIGPLLYDIPLADPEATAQTIVQIFLDGVRCEENS